MNFVQGNIYQSAAKNGAKFVYRCVRADGENFEFVDLMSWRHVNFLDDGNWFYAFENTEFEHEIRDDNCIGEHVDVES